MTDTKLRIEPLSGGRFGAEVIGADLAALDDAEFASITSALADHVLLVFRGQETLRPEDQIAFSLRFGPLLQPQLREYTLDEFPGIGILSNDRKEDGTPVGLANSGRNWHTDVQFDRTPPDATFLVSRILPDEGGDTLFTNMFLALEALPAGTRRRIEGLRVVHSRVRSWPILFPDRPPLPPEEAARYPDVSPSTGAHPPGQRSQGALCGRQHGGGDRGHERHRGDGADRRIAGLRHSRRVRSAAAMAAGGRSVVGQPLRHALRHAVRRRAVPPRHAPNQLRSRSSGLVPAWQRQIPNDA